MLRTQVIGCGAAGNKATINLVSKHLLPDDKFSYLLVNTTQKDIPAEYRGHAMIFGDNAGGCGKERDLGKRMLLEDMDHGIRSIEKKIDPYADFIIVCGATEGGSGSASIPIISKYLSQVMHIPVIVVLFFGFNNDARGMQNSIEICQELEDDIGVISICNSRFLDKADNNKLLAEKLANDMFCEYVQTLVGKDIHESSQNIDDTDLKKVILTPGYMNIEFIPIKRVKNTEQYESAVDSAIDFNSVSMASPNKSAKRIAAIFDAKSDSSYIDFGCDVFKKRYGTPYELFIHVQDPDENVTSEGVTVIVSGQNLPLDEVREIFEAYKETSGKVARDIDKFFAEVEIMHGDSRDADFNMFSNTKNKNQIKEADRDSFFESFGMKTPKPGSKKADDSSSKGTGEPKVKDIIEDY